MEADYCNSLASLNPFGSAKRNLTGRANPQQATGNALAVHFQILVLYFLV